MRNKILMLSTVALLAGTLAAAGQSIQPGGAGGATQEKGQQGSVKGKEGAQAPKAGQVQREGQETLKGQTQSFQVTGGFVEVRNNHVRVLADKAE